MSSKIRILYVDDEEPNTVVFKAAFKGNNFEVTTTESASSALALLEKDKFDIIVSDQRMPGMTGVDFFTTVRSKEIQGVRILMTGFADNNVMMDAINKAHIFYYCTKPWKAKELKNIFLNAIEFADRK